MRGTLGVASDIADAFDLEEYEFAVEGNAGFALRRGCFAGASFYPHGPGGRLIVCLHDSAQDARDDPPAAIVHIVAPVES